MNFDRIAAASLTQLIEWVTTGEIGLPEVAAAQLERVRELNPHLNAFLSVNEQLEEDARRLQQRLSKDRAAFPLAGAVISVKDLMPAVGLATTAGSKAHPVSVADRDAAVVARLRAAGCLILGKTNLHEFAYGVTSENEHFGAVRNPFSAERVAGGSSGGSAAALAAGLGNGSIGTDTRGSIRIPSSCCNTTGLKPTRDLVPTADVIPLSPTLDHVGPMARSVRDVFVLLEIMTATRIRTAPVAGLRLGWCPEWIRDVDGRVAGCFQQALRTLESVGLVVGEVRLEGMEAALHASDVIARAEAVAYHDHQLQTSPHLYGKTVRTRLMTGFQLSAVELVRALETAADTRRRFASLFEQVDLLAVPVLPVLPPPLGSSEVETPSGRSPLVPSMVRFNAPQNVAGVPALSLPAGLVDSLPVGIQLVAAWNDEALLRGAGEAFQEASEWHLERPRQLNLHQTQSGQ